MVNVNPEALRLRFCGGALVDRAFIKAGVVVCIFAVAAAISSLSAAPLESCDAVEPATAQKNCISRNIEQLQAGIKDGVFAKRKSHAGAGGSAGSAAVLETLICAEQRFTAFLQEAQ